MLEAAEACPAVAISVVDEETGETVFPDALPSNYERSLTIR